MRHRSKDTRSRKPIHGFTLIELMITMAICTIVVLGLGVLMADSQKGWNKMYQRVYSDAVSDGYVAKIKFDSIVRKSSRGNFLIDPMGKWVEVYYYQDLKATVPDRYARFYESGDDLNVEYGRVDPRETLSTETICSNVSDCLFLGSNGSVKMNLSLDDGQQQLTMLTSAIMHNE